jgi:hypothetical protein
LRSSQARMRARPHDSRPRRRPAPRAPRDVPRWPSRTAAGCPAVPLADWVGLPVQKESIPLTRARQVIGPTMPSTVTDGMSWWRACWKPRAAASVLGPKIPSTWRPLPGSPDRLRNWTPPGPRGRQTPRTTRGRPPVTPRLDLYSRMADSPTGPLVASGGQCVPFALPAGLAIGRQPPGLRSRRRQRCDLIVP